MDKVKSLLITHGEKILAGVCALFGFLALTGAHWAADHRVPDELKSISSEKQAAIDQNQWPAEEKELFREIKDVRALTAVEKQHKIDPSDFQIAAINPSIIRTREKRSLVTIVAPARPVADPIVVTIAMPPKTDEDEDADGLIGDEGATEAGGEEALTEEEEIEKLMNEKYGLQSTAVVGIGGSGGEGYPGGEAYPGSEGNPGSDEDMMLSGGASGGYEGGGYEGGSDLYGQFGGSEMMAEKTRIRVSAGVSVRMTVNLQEQRRILRKALHLGSGYEESQREILYTDLKVERRQKTPEHDEFDEWQPLSSEDLGEILEESFGIDRDVVNPGVTRNTITMPLPRRASGQWTAAVASHPDLENFELSDAEKALIDKWNAMVTERLDEQKKNTPVVVEAKGFSMFVQSATDMGSMYGGGMESGMGGSGGYEGGGGGGGYEDMMDNYESNMGDGGKLTAKDKATLDATRATAEKRLLLVRFMDFTIERGYTYQYRVRLEMKNPNYNKPLDQLEDPSLGAEPVLVSGWSEVTPPAFVPQAHRMYVAEVDARAGRLPEAKMSVFTDTTETGMPLLGKVSVQAGMPISGTVKKEVVDLTIKAVEERNVDVMTDAVLAGADEMMRLSSTDHPELRTILTKLERGATLIPSQITIVDSDGAIKLRSIGDDSKQERMDKAEAAYILKTYSDAWSKPAGGMANDFFGEGGGEGEGGGNDGGMGLGMASGSSSAGGFFGGGGETGKRMSSRAKARAKRDAKKNGTFGAGSEGGGGTYE